MKFNLSKLKKTLNKPIDIAGLVYFRIAFGLLLIWDVYQHFDYNWITRYWIEPDFFFTYEGFSWITPWAGDGMYYHFYVLGLCAFFIAIGFLYRISIILFFLGFLYVLLLDKTNYLNHNYLIVLLSFIMSFLPANRSFSIDALIFPKIKTAWVPNWTLLWLKIQLGVVYFFGGLAKVNSDWLRGEPMRIWLSQRTDFPVIGQWFTEEWMVFLFAYGGMLLDLLIFPLLMFKKTRIPAAIVLVSFHLMNSQLFIIGIFPWFMIAATVIFFPSEKLRLWKKLKSKKPAPFVTSKRVLLGLAIYLLLQVTIPLRHFLYKGNVSWTEEGHRFSWHMKLRRKQSSIKFIVAYHNTRTTKAVDLSKYLSVRQSQKVKSKPDMIVQFAHYLAAKEAQEGKVNISIHAVAECSLNGRPRADLINSSVDLATVTYPFYKKAKWILPLKLPLKK